MPVPALEETGPEWSRNCRLRKCPVLPGRAGRLLLGHGACCLKAQGAFLGAGAVAGSEGDGVAGHHFIPSPTGSAFTINASACWQYRICASIPARERALRIPAIA